jgi:hypothetical protein
MSFDTLPVFRHLLVSYVPRAHERSFEARAESQQQADLKVTLAVLDGAESRRYFGTNLARRGVQPVWLRVENQATSPYRLNVVSIDPNYYSPHEAAAVCHFSSGKRLLGFGVLAWLFLPLLLLVPLKLLGAWLANRRMDAFFRAQAFRLRPVPGGGGAAEGFVFTPLDAGAKVVHARFLGRDETLEFVFTVSVPGLDADYLRRELHDPYPADALVECNPDQLALQIAAMPPTTTNRQGTRSGDPVNLVVAGDFPTLLSAFGARWDETETISLASCWRTLKAFLLGAEYRYSPVSALYLFDRSQDFALQRVRQSINERLHLRLWTTPLRFRGQPVWVGQVSRDIGVRFTWRTWNLTTHRIDSDVDEARDYVVEDLLEAGRLEMLGYVTGVGECASAAPRHNLTGDPYFTDGKRAAILVSASRTTPHRIDWF